MNGIKKNPMAAPIPAPVDAKTVGGMLGRSGKKLKTATYVIGPSEAAIRTRMKKSAKIIVPLKSP